MGVERPQPYQWPFRVKVIKSIWSDEESILKWQMSSLRDLVWQSYSKFSRHLILSSMCFPNTCRSKFYFIKTENLGKCQRNALWIFTYDKFSCPYLALLSYVSAQAGLYCLPPNWNNSATIVSAFLEAWWWTVQHLHCSVFQTCSSEALVRTQVIQGFQHIDL